MSSLSTLSFNPLQIAPKSPRKEPPNRAIVSLDLDGSLIGPATEQSIAVLNRLHDQKRIFTLINTGNDLSQLKAYGYGEALAGLKVDAVALNDGQELYLNPNADNQTAEHWFKNLKASDRDQDWLKCVDKLGWNVPSAVKIILSSIDLQKNNPDFKNFSFSTRDDKAKFNIRGPVEESSQRKVGELLKEISEQLAKQGIHAIGRYSISGNIYKVVFGPEGIHKAAPIDFLVGQLPSITGVVSLGDNDNDHEMLVAKEFKKNGHVATNFPILVGGFTLLRKALEKNSKALFTTGNEVPKALEAQIESATTQRSFSALA